MDSTCQKRISNFYRKPLHKYKITLSYFYVPFFYKFYKSYFGYKYYSRIINHSKVIQKNDKRANKEGFEFEGSHYTNYEGTQLQRKIETKIRQLKERQIGAKAIDDMDEVYKCQEKITQLTSKYNDLSKVSGLPTKINRLRVEGFTRVKFNKNVIIPR